MVKGVSRERMSDGTIHSDFTMWATVKDITNGVFYYRTYEDLCIKKVDLKKLDFLGDETKSISLYRLDEFEDVSEQLS